MKISKIHLLTCFLILCIYGETIARTKSPQTIDAEVMMVRSSSFQKCPDVTVDDMANAFFGSPSWSVSTKKGFKYVNLKGKVLFNKKTVRALLPFKITGPNDWSLGDLEMNDVPQIPLLRAGLLDRMCESAQANAPAAAAAPAAEAPAAEAPAAANGDDAPAAASNGDDAPAAEAPAAEAPAAEAPSARKPRKSKAQKR